jgi:mono/diheme cytochrome c family protein
VATAGAALSITTSSPLAAATFGTAYSQALAAAGGTTPYLWALASGSAALPAGLTLSAAGVITGTPTAPAVPNATTSNFTVGVNDAASGSTTRPLAITASLSASASSGKTIYDANCAGCHQLGIYDTAGSSPDLGGLGAATLTTGLDARFGGGGSHNGKTLTATQITDVLNFLILY